MVAQNQRNKPYNHNDNAQPIGIATVIVMVCLKLRQIKIGSKITNIAVMLKSIK